MQKSGLGVDQPEIASGLSHPIGEEGVVLLSLLYLILRAALRLFVRRSDRVHELEIVVLRHQLSILRRQVPPTELESKRSDVARGRTPDRRKAEVGMARLGMEDD